MKYLVSQDGQYQAFDAREQALAGKQDVFGALCSALPDTELTALSLSRWDSQGLRTRLAALAAADRTRAGQLLGQRVLQPWFKLPLLTEHGAGYPLSGRGCLVGPASTPASAVPQPQLPRHGRVASSAAQAG